MIAKRCIWLALGAAVVLESSCLRAQRARHEHALAVKAESEADLTRAQTEALRNSTSEEPEYVEAQVPPEAPVALPEERSAAPSSEHMWVGGAHTRRDGRWVWSAGRWVLPPRSDVVWVPGHWVPHLHGFAWIGGAWR